jgi:hypothetical protein
MGHLQVPVAVSSLNPRGTYPEFSSLNRPELRWIQNARNNYRYFFHCEMDCSHKDPQLPTAIPEGSCLSNFLLLP